MSEAETRRRIIDERLRLAGWKLNDPSQVIPELDLFLATQGERVTEVRAGYDTHQFADYGFLLQAKPGLVLETKRTSKDAEAGQEQGLQYAQCAQGIYGGPLPRANASKLRPHNRRLPNHEVRIMKERGDGPEKAGMTSIFCGS